ncbi:tRNA lysidine(34) synthetase TilS [uncultured Shewanella sp.]|uniref:tRNA lysidine(34) synthetase TilS n=1 Tax=uncultured Shewanella sp. TaxID=173975 RepID=UPI00260FE9DC|nr:tRNA lysidine(34) synthetase TilS [uncultured Shewanella sp.]
MSYQAINIAQLIENSLTKSDIHTGAKLVLAYSGGVDSEVLLHGLSEFAIAHPTQFKYHLIHVHHGLSANSDEWAEHCQRQALAYQLPFTLEKVTVRTGARLSIEAEARAVRYAAIAKHMRSGDVLLTAHHQDDQLETLLLALKRGLGPKGLASMGESQAFDSDKHLLRPLLQVERAQIEQYAENQALTHIEDESNHNTQFDRNFLRREIIPQLKARWPSIGKTANRSAQLCFEQQAVLDDEVAKKLPLMLSVSAWGQGLNLTLLAQQSDAWQALLMRAFIEKQGFQPLSHVQNKELLTQVLLAKVDAKQAMQVGNMLARRFGQNVYLFDAKAEARLTKMFTQWAKAPIPLSWHSLPRDTDAPIILFSFNDAAEDAQEHLMLYGHSLTGNAMPLIRPPKATETVTLRFGIAGSTRCQPHFRDKGRELKKLWQELNVAPWARARVPMIFYNDTLVCAVGYWVEKGFMLKEGLKDEYALPVNRSSVDGAVCNMSNMTQMSQATGLAFRVE